MEDIFCCPEGQWRLVLRTQPGGSLCVVLESHRQHRTERIFVSAAAPWRAAYARGGWCSALVQLVWGGGADEAEGGIHSEPEGWLCLVDRRDSHGGWAAPERILSVADAAAYLREQTDARPTLSALRVDVSRVRAEDRVLVALLRELRRARWVTEQTHGGAQYGGARRLDLAQQTPPHDAWARAVGAFGPRVLVVHLHPAGDPAGQLACLDAEEDLLEADTLVLRLPAGTASDPDPAARPQHLWPPPGQAHPTPLRMAPRTILAISWRELTECVWTRALRASVGAVVWRDLHIDMGLDQATVLDAAPEEALVCVRALVAATSKGGMVRLRSPLCGPEDACHAALEALALGVRAVAFDPLVEQSLGPALPDALLALAPRVGAHLERLSHWDNPSFPLLALVSNG